MSTIMTERTGHYFWGSIYTFDDDARQDILRLVTRDHPDLSVTYNSKNAIFELACPNLKGPEVDEAFAVTAATYVIEEFERAEKEDRNPKVKQFEDSQVDPFPEEPALPQLSLHQNQRTSHNTISSLIINNESKKIDVGIIRLSEIPDPILRRLLVSNNPRIFSLVRAVQRDFSYKVNLNCNAYLDSALSYSHKLDHLLFHPRKPVGKVWTAEQNLENEQQAQTWQFDGFRPTVRQWLAGMGKTKLVDPNEKCSMPAETARMIQAPLSQPIVGRPRVARVARVPTNTSTSSESDSDSDSDKSSSDPSKSKSFFSRYHQPTDPEAVGSHLTRRQRATELQIEDTVHSSSLQNRADNHMPPLSTGFNIKDSASLQLPTSRVVDKVSVEISDKRTSQPNKHLVDVPNTISAASDAHDGFPDWSQYANVDKYGLTGHPSRQADWEHQSYFGSSGLRASKHSMSKVPISSLALPSSPTPHQGSFEWENKMNYSPAIPTGTLVDILEDTATSSETSFAQPDSVLSSKMAETNHPHVTRPTVPSTLLQSRKSQLARSHNNSVEERLLLFDEKDFPPLRNTMRQKAGKTKKKKEKRYRNLGNSSKASQFKPLLELPEPLPPSREVQKKSGLESKPILQNICLTGNEYLNVQFLQQTTSILQNCQFPASANLHFGVALLQNSVDQGQVYSAQKAQTRLSVSQDACDFTNRITSSDRDIGAVLETLLEQNIVDLESSIFYEIQLQDVNKQLHILKIDPDRPSQYSTSTQSQSYGIITIFNVIRSHDMRLEVVTAKDAASNLPQRIFDSIVKSLECNSDATEIRGVLPPEIAAVPTVQYKHIIKLADMEFVYTVDYLLDPGRNLSAKRLNDESMRSNHRMWWAIKLSDNREISDQGSGINICKGLFTKAAEIVKLLDGVGYSNEGPLKEYAADMKRLEEEQREAEKAALPKFW